MAVEADSGGRLSTRPGGGRIVPGHPAARAPAIPLRKPTARSAAKEDDLHVEMRRGSRLSPATDVPYFLATYAVTSIVTATTVNSGLVHSMRVLPREMHRPARRCVKSPHQA